MEENISQILVEQAKNTAKIGSLDEKFKDSEAKLNRFKDDVKDDISDIRKKLARMETNFDGKIKDVRVDMKSEDEKIWNAIDKQRSLLNQMLWKIFGLVTVPIIFLIIATLLKKVPA